ncbi:murein transglycosylase A [Phaeovulum sp.]|uniref:murein transglycosylase A n=1 Tax=Phaeovulum sp. TaxID=2934796 RepID=UPI0039E4F615
MTRCMRALGFADLPGWDADDHAAAWAAFSVTCPHCPDAISDPRAWFEAHFTPDEIAPGAAHYTGYYEPELLGAMTPSPRYSHPLYAPPPRLAAQLPWHDRARIMADNLLAGHELVWLQSAIEAFLVQVQGSVRVRLAEGGILRLGFAAGNGQPYRSIGAELVNRGAISAAEISSNAICAWCAANPAQVQDLLNHNPSFVFFHPLDLPEDTGPLGAMGAPVTAQRSLAVDPAYVPLGIPVWVDCPGIAPRLMVAQDTGSAIKGAGRGDIFCGTGDVARAQANGLNTTGRMIVLRPRKALP